jgi:3-isopropylmalate dehydrogenase
MSQPKLFNIAVLSGDGIGVEIVTQAVRVLECIAKNAAYQIQFNFNYADVGGVAYDKHGHPLPQATLDIAQQSHAILFGAVGDWKYDILERHLRPEQAILGLRKHFDLFANFRPAKLFPQLVHTSSLKPEFVSDLDILIIRELGGDVYFGQPRGMRKAVDGPFIGHQEGFDTMRYSLPEVERIAHVAFQAAQKRNKKLCSVDKSNVLETSQLWRNVMIDVAKQYTDVELTHMYVDNAAMQLVKAPKAFDVIVTGNLFGDILSDQASMLCGSIGMLASASLNKNGFGLYEPSHGSAPDIAGQNKANPLATVLSAAMMLRFSFDMQSAADAIERAIFDVLEQGLRTPDIYSKQAHEQLVSTTQMGDALLKVLN